MDVRGMKRPPENSSKKKDKTKKRKKSKPPPRGTDGDDSTSSLEATATADGQYMAKILSTFSKLEQSRFVCFKRISFPCYAVSRYVAHCLMERQQYRHDQQNKRGENLLVQKLLEEPKSLHIQDLVVPGQEEEVTTVVATLAKAYAQRLCAAAKFVQQHKEIESGNGISADGGGTMAAMKPEHVLQAFHARKQQGLDPGFFLQQNHGITIGAHPGSTEREQIKRVAALAAQEAFEQVYSEYEELVQRGKQTNLKP